MSEETAPISAKKSYKDGHVGIGIKLRCRGYDGSASIDGSADLTTGQARELARSLIELADQARVSGGMSDFMASRQCLPRPALPIRQVAVILIHDPQCRRRAPRATNLRDRGDRLVQLAGADA